MGTRAQPLNKLLTFASTHERRLGALLFAFGFLTDLLTFTLLPLSAINIVFAAYLGLAAVCTLGANVMHRWSTKDEWWRKTLAVVFPLGLQYALGGFLSGFVVFYASHSVVTVSWPFLLLLALVYIGNEYFRKQRDHLIFQTALFYFALYAYAIFALPLFIGSIGPWIFLLSTIAALILFALFLWILYRIDEKKAKENLNRIRSIVAGITIFVTGAYFTGTIPPIPLILSDAAPYHSISRVAGNYVVQTEEPKPWWDLRQQTIHITPGSSVVVFASVVAPASFGSTVVHRWEYESDGDWVTMNRVAFPISGGRQGGYRGYSEKTNAPEGQWRVSIETEGGQVIGRLGFAVDHVAQTPNLISEQR
jgi:MFS family permease